MIDYGLDGKVALVTGAGSGLGRAAAQSFAHSGAAVLISDVNEDSGGETVAMIEKAGGKASFFRCDVADGEQVDAMVAAVLERYGKLDCAFNNAGIARMEDDEYEDEAWDRSIAINLTGVMKCIRAEAKAMVGAGGGAIVNTASIMGLVANPQQAAYTAGKHGVVGLTKHAALRWAKQGIRVNAVCPGVIQTNMTQMLFDNPEIKQGLDAMTPMGRMGKPEEVGEAVVWLCSKAASFITGHAMVIDGGWTAA